MRRTVIASDLEREPWRAWNAFVDLIAAEAYHDLTEAQRLAHLAFWYDSEVQNGGHFQYFENSAGAMADEAVEALKALGLRNQASVLERAIARRECMDREPIETVDDFVEDALAGEYDDLDLEYHSCAPSIQQALERYLDEHRGEFVEVVSA